MAMLTSHLMVSGGQVIISIDYTVAGSEGVNYCYFVLYCRAVCTCGTYQKGRFYERCH